MILMIISGFTVDRSEDLLPDVQFDLLAATESFTTTVQGKKVRFRFLPVKLLSAGDLEQIDDWLLGLPHLYALRIQAQNKKVDMFREEFMAMIQKSSDVFDR